ncbi:MAG: TlpA disulfide reductase family protein [Burkholderiaceae bacterium]
MKPGLRAWLTTGGAAIVALAIGAGVGLLHRQTPATGAAVPLDHLLGQQVPDATGQPVDMSVYRGRVLVLNFWATWCPPCVQEMPEIDDIQAEYRDQGVTVLGLGLDTSERITAFSEKLKVNYPLFAMDAAGLAVVRDFGNEQGALPYTMVYDRQGREVARKLGRISREELRRAVERALAGSS